jgi:exonuclease III
MDRRNPRQRSLSPESGLPRLSSRAQTMDNWRRLQYDPHARGKRRGGGGGGGECLEQESLKFQELIDHLKLVDIENGNGTYTWTNKRSGHQQIACRLDCFLISETLLLEGPMVESNILPKVGSDHGLFSFGLIQ